MEADRHFALRPHGHGEAEMEAYRHFALRPHGHGEAEMEADRHFALCPHGHGEAEMEADRHLALRPHGHGEAEADRHFALRPHGHGETEADRHFALHPHGHGEAEAEADHFVVAARAYLFWGEKSPNLCIYDSATKTWSNKPVVMGSYTGTHLTNKTLTIGGSNGTVAWVDLWRNIVFCDVFAKRPKLSCLKLPTTPDAMWPRIEARSVRDIAVVGDTIKYVDMQPQPGTSDWMVTTWSIKKARRSWPKEWHMEGKLDSTHIKVDAARAAATLPTLSSLCVGMPTLSLQKQNNDAIVYFLAKTSFSPMERTAWVLAVDMENETAEQVVEFPAKRTYCLAKGYDASRISAYLQPAPGTQQTSKRPGVPLLKCPSKKHIKDVEDPEEDDAMVISYSWGCMEADYGPLDPVQEFLSSLSHRLLYPTGFRLHGSCFA
ncbi:hypothetical protein D1007_05040 [Hordeum vulgare]|nr:hypothetical protein D1007_05040 [Hordeum vulgare]